MSNTQRQDGTHIEAEIRRLASRPEIGRSLRALPQFRVDSRLPDTMSALLKTLDRTDQQAV